MPGNYYIWHENIQTHHTRRSFISEVAPEVMKTFREWLAKEQFPLPGGYQCRIVARSTHCLEAAVYTPSLLPWIRIGVANRPRCGHPLWVRLGGVPDARPREPWCAVSLHTPGAQIDPEVYPWLGDFERCLAWAFMDGGVIG